MKRTIRLAALAAALAMALAGALPAAAQTFEEAVTAYERGDYATAYRGFRSLAEQGDASAQHNLALMYLNSHGVPQDYAEAVKWSRRAAEQGHAHAQHNLGLMYYYGDGVPQDYVEAVKWSRRAAEQGDAIAQNNLGLMYDDGHGVPQDYAEAVKWYRRAAEQGNAIAQNNLGLMYGKGHGVPQDHVRAHMWFNLAASRFSATEREDRENAEQNRDIAARLLSPEALARAQRMAREWRPKADTESSSPPPRAAGGVDDTQARVAAIQRALARLGYDPGSADGVLGPKTRAAIRAFQADIGLPKDGRLSERLESAVLAALAAAAPKREPARRALERASTGSGFRVSTAGHILTNAHVVRECAELRVPPAGRIAVAARDEAADLAFPAGPAGGAVAAFRQGRGIRAGAGVVVVGYPLRGVLASGANVAAGNVAALAGPGDDRRLIQITAPVQPGNSGGPVLDSAGNAVGAVVSKLDAIAMAQATGDIPQNVNFAVGAGAARAFLDAEGVAYETAPSEKARPPDEVAAAAKRFTVLVECWN